MRRMHQVVQRLEHTALIGPQRPSALQHQDALFGIGAA